MGYLEGLSKSIDVAVPLALKLHEMRRNEALAAQKMQLDRQQWAQAFKETQKKNAVYAQSEKIKAGLPLTDTDTQSAFGTNLPREAVFVREMEAPSAEALRAQLAGPDYKPLENLQITPTNPVPGRGFQAEDFEGATKFDVSGQKIIQPVSEATKKLQATIAERLAAAEEKRREFDASLALREQLARIADATRREGIDSRNLLQEGLNELRRQGISIQQGNLDARREENQRRVKELEGKMSDADKARLKLIEEQLSVTPAAKEGWFGGKPESDPRQDLLNQYDAILKKYDKLAAGAPKPSNVIRYDAKGNRL